MLKWVKAYHPSRACYKTTNGRFVIENLGVAGWYLDDKVVVNKICLRFNTLKEAKQGAEDRSVNKSEWKIVWDTENSTDAFYADTFESAKADAEDTLVQWKTEQSSNYPINCKEWTEQQINDWDYMIANCSVSVYKYNGNADKYEEHWSPSYEDEKNLGWLYHEELIKLTQ